MIAYRSFIWWILVSLTALVPAHSSQLSLDPQPESINAVRFDPSYYYNAPVRTNALAQQLAEKWQAQGVHVIFYKAYDPVYGAKYRTDYELNAEADYGRQNLLKYILAACGERGIQVVAWLPAFQHKAAWEQHPDWRVVNPDGSDYRLNEQHYPLCAAHEQVRTWWLGLLRDLLDHYPELTGIDMGEPVVRWQGATCNCASCVMQQRETGWPDVSALGLNKTLLSCFELIHQRNKIACVTSVISPQKDGSLYTPAEQRGLTGFDLEALLSHAHKPDWISLELMWQQWADLFNNPALFSPNWVQGAAAVAKAQVASRSRLLVHLELTPFGQHYVDAARLQASILAAKQADLCDIDIYDTHQLDRDEAWPALTEAFAWQPTRNVLIISDPLGENDARQVASLLSHFRAQSDILLLQGTAPYASGRLQHYDFLFYIGVDPKFALPDELLQDAKTFQGTIAWIHFGLGQFLQQPGIQDYGFQYAGTESDSTWNRVRYKAALLPKQDPDFDRIAITDSARCAVHAWMERSAERLPYALHSGNLWYFADLTTAFVVEGGNYIVFADLLHDILRQNHRSSRLAMVRIEDISPLSDIASLRSIADYLHDADVPFSISLVPFYLDPASNTAASLSDQPDFVKTIQYMVRKGGVIVMHGNTHQYRGETTADYEFWDMMHDGPLFADSREYVRERIETGMAELVQNGLYPVTWETPHYGASQLDYEVINQYFSSAYERRQTLDLHGSDQLLPWLIYEHSAGGKIIPENLGYIPLSRQEAGPLLEAARNNLALRDGIASFFFHPFVDISVLKEIIPAMKKMGYRFTDPRHTSQQVHGRTFRVVTGTADVVLPMGSGYSHEFFLDKKGDKHDEIYSEQTRSDTLRKTVTVPEGWIYIAEAIPDKPAGPLLHFISSLSQRVPRLYDYVEPSLPLTAADEPPPRLVLLHDPDAPGPLARGQANWEQAFAAAGIDAVRIEVRDFFTVPEGGNLIVVPAAAAARLNQQQTLLLIRSVQNGANIILERPSELSSAMGITVQEESYSAQGIVDEYYPTVPIQWSSTDTLSAFDTEFDYVVYASEPVTSNPVVIGGEYGAGRYLYFAAYLDPAGEGGYSRFPFLLEMIRYQFQLKPPVRREAVEIYFDPGSREEISIEDLIKMWRKNGVRTIYAAGWHEYLDYTYEYGRLIELAHQNAMRVYLWLQLPHVSEKFWLEHPPWREKNGLGADVDTSRAHWRRPMALNDPACREAVMTHLRTLLTTHAWDGINLAELYYDTPEGPEAPQWFSPMNQAFRETFSTRHGFDPHAIFTPTSARYWRRDAKALAALYDLRQEMIVDLHRQFLQFFHALAQEKGAAWEIVITTLDDAMAPQMAAKMGVTTSAIAALNREIPFVLQLEEPPLANAESPQDYLKMAERAKAYSSTPSAMITINLVERPESPKLTTRQITGLELYRTLQQCQAEDIRVALNSEASLYDVDNGCLPLALATAAHESLATFTWHIETSATVALQLDPRRNPDVLVNGDIWPAYHRGHLILPAGKHLIQPINRTRSLLKGFWAEGRLVALSAELLELKRLVRGMELRYRSQTPNWVVLSEKPHAIVLDGKSLAPSFERGELGYSFALPAGEHHAEILVTSRGTQLVKQISLALSGFIAFAGIVFGAALGILWMKSSRSRRKKH